MRLPRLSILSLAFTLVLSITLLTGCGKGKDQAAPDAAPAPTAVASASSEETPMPSGMPFLVISQTPETPRPGQFIQHPRGLLVAMWDDGRVVRAVDVSNVGNSYVTGTVDKKERDALLEYLQSSEVKNAPKPPHLRLHVATLVATLRSGDGTEKWITELPNNDSPWVRLVPRLLSVPLKGSHPADLTIVRSIQQGR